MMGNHSLYHEMFKVKQLKAIAVSVLRKYYLKTTQQVERHHEMFQTDLPYNNSTSGKASRNVSD